MHFYLCICGSYLYYSAVCNEKVQSEIIPDMLRLLYQLLSDQLFPAELYDI